MKTYEPIKPVPLCPCCFRRKECCICPPPERGYASPNDIRNDGQ